MYRHRALFKLWIINVHKNSSKLFCENDIWPGSFPVIVLIGALCPSSSDKTRSVHLLKSVKVKQWELVLIYLGSVPLPSARNSGFRFIRGYPVIKISYICWGLDKALKFTSGQFVPGMFSRLEDNYAIYRKDCSIFN